MAHETEPQPTPKPETDNVVFLDELPQFIDRRKANIALGQLTLFANGGMMAEVHHFQTPNVHELPRRSPDDAA